MYLPAGKGRLVANFNSDGSQINGLTNPNFGVNEGWFLQFSKTKP